MTRWASVALVRLRGLALAPGRRKNRPQGSGKLMRMCSCKGSPTTCIVHTFYDKFWAELPDGARPWAHLSAGGARTALRRTLARLAVPEAECFGTHDFRRGAAEVGQLAALHGYVVRLRAFGYSQDLRQSGCTLAQIIKAGQWSSAAFMCYMDEAGLDKEAAYLVATDSGDEEWIE